MVILSFITLLWLNQDNYTEIILHALYLTELVFTVNIFFWWNFFLFSPFSILKSDSFFYNCSINSF